MSVKSNISLLRQDVEYLKQEEMKNRRKLRLLQVRQQNREHATKIRQKVQKKKCDEILRIAHELDRKHEEEQQAKIEAAQKTYLQGLENFGQAYTNIDSHQVLEKKAKEMHYKNQIVAHNRYSYAINDLKTTENLHNQTEIDYRNRKNLVRNKEKLRAKKVASLPKPLVDKTDEKLGSTKCMTSLSDLTRSHHSSFYGAAAIRHTGDYDAKAAAEDEEKMFKGLSKEKSCLSLAMQEKAYLRHKAAVSQERLNQDLLSLEKEIQQLRNKEKFRR